MKSYSKSSYKNHSMLWKVKIPIDKPWAQFWMSHKTHKEKDNSCNAAKANIPSSSSSELPM